MADEVDEKVLEVLLNRSYLFMVVISKSRSISELRTEIQNVARELFTELRGEISILETTNGARLPNKYEVGRVLCSESSILAYTSDYKMLTERKRKLSSAIQPSDRPCKAKRKRRKASSAANGHDKNTCRSLKKFADRSVENSEPVSEDDDEDGGDVLARTTALPENTGDSEQSLSSEVESNDMAVDQIKRKLCFSECSRVQKETVDTKSRATNTTRQKSRKVKVTVTKKGECAKKRINGDEKKKKEGSKRFKINHSDKDLEITTVNNANFESEESSRTLISLSDHKETMECKGKKQNVQHMSSKVTYKRQSQQRGIRIDNTQQGERVKTNDKELSQDNPGASQRAKAVPEMQRHRTEMSQDKPTTRATRSTVREQPHPIGQDSAFVREFLDDMRKLQNESEYNERPLRRRVYNTRGQVRNTETCRDVCELEAAKNSAKDGNSLPTPKTMAGNHCNSRDAILSASKFRSLFSLPEHCQVKRKEAIEKSASKVADWLDTNNISPSVNKYARDSDTEDSDTEGSGRESEDEASPKHVRGTATTSVRQRKQAARSDVDGDDNGGTEANSPSQASAVFSLVKDVGSQTKKITKMNNSTLKTRNATDGKHYKNELINASQESEVREVIRIPGTSSLAGNISVNKRLSVSSVESASKTCHVKIKKLPYSRQDGKLKVTLGSTAINLVPCHVHDGCSTDNDDGGDQRDRSLRSSRTRNTDSKNVNCEQSQVGKTMETTLCGIDRGIESNEITKAGDRSSANNKFHLTAVELSCHDSEEGLKSLSPLSEVNCSSRSIANEDSEWRGHERDVVHNKTTRVPGQRGVDNQDEEDEETPHMMIETARKGADSKEETVPCQTQDNEGWSVNEISSNDTTKASSRKQHIQMSNEGLSPLKTNVSVAASLKHKHSAPASLCGARDNTDGRGLLRISEGTPTEITASKTDMYPSEIQDSVELSKEHAGSFANKVSDAKTENEVSIMDEDSSANSDGSNDDNLHSELTKRVGTSRKQILSVNTAVDTACCDEEVNNDSETTKSNHRKGERSKKDKLLLPAVAETLENTSGVSLNEEHGNTGVEKTFGTSRGRSKPKNDREPGRGNSKSTDLKGKNLAGTTNHDPVEKLYSDEEEKNGKMVKSPKKFKSRSTSQNNVEHLQSVNHITSVASEQEEQNEPAKNLDGIPQNISNRDHGNSSTVDSVDRSESGKRERKNSNTNASKSAVKERSKVKLVAEREHGLNSADGSCADKIGDTSASEDLLEKDRLGSLMKRKVKESSPVKHKDYKRQLKESAQKSAGDQVESKPVSDDAVSETDEDIEEENNSNCCSPLHLTPFKEGKQVVWMKERPRKKESEQGGLDYTKAIKRLDMTHSTPVCPSDKSKRHETAVDRNEAGMNSNESKGQNDAVYMESRDSGGTSAPKKKKATKKHKKEVSSVQEVTKVSKPFDSQKKASKALLSLLDPGQDDSTEHRNNTTVNRKALTSPRKTVQRLMRQFRQTPKGFCHTVKSRKLSASTSSVHIRRKVRKIPREKSQPKDMSTKEKELAANTIGFEQLLEDDSLWDT